MTDHLPGMWFVGTASHGGIKLDRARNAKVPKSCRADGGWYEEDCDWAIPVCVFEDEVRESGKMAKTLDAGSHKDTLRNWHPEAYKAIYGEPVAVEDSHVLRKRAAAERNRNKFVGVAGSGSWHKTVPEGFVGVHLAMGGWVTEGNVTRHGKPEITKLVPEAEYGARDEFGFVVDPDQVDKYADWAA